MRIKELLPSPWVELYSGKDEAKYRKIRQKLDEKNISYRGKEYNSQSRIAMHSLGVPPVPFSRGPAVTPYKLQANLLSEKKLDSYYIEVKKRDFLRAHKCMSLSGA